MKRNRNLSDAKFIIAKTKFGAEVKLRRIKEGKLSENNLFDTYGKAYRHRKFLYRPAEWKEYKIWIVPNLK